MAEVLGRGEIIGWEAATEIYAEEVVGINVFENAACITLAVNRVEPGKGEGAKAVRAVVVRLVLPFVTANELVRQLNNAAGAIVLDDATAGSSQNH